MILLAKLKKIMFATGDFERRTVMVIAGVINAEMGLLMLTMGKNVMMGIDIILMDVVLNV